MSPKALGVGGDVLTGCLPCRGWLAWCPRLRTLLLDLLLIYISVPFLVRLFPVMLTKFVFLNLCECPEAVPTGKVPPKGFSKQEAGRGSPKHWVSRGQHPSNPPSLAMGLQRRHGGTFPVGASCFASCNNAVPPTLFAARSCNTSGHAQRQRG